MSQTALPAPAARPGASSDAPDLFYVLRHYRWLIVLGALVGLLMGAGLYWVLRQYAPKYRAQTLFQVLPSNANPIQPMRGEVITADTNDEMTRVIRRQIMMVLTPEVLEAALGTDEVKRTHWYARSLPNPKKELLKVLDVTPVANSDLFQIALTISEREEVATIVTKIAEVYQQQLANKTKEQETERARQVENARRSLDEQIRSVKARLEDFRQKHDVQSITNSYGVVTGTLAQLSAELIKYESDYNALRKTADETAEAAKKPDFQLPRDVMATVEGNSSLQYLQQTRLALEQELSVQEKLYGPGSRPVTSVKERMAVADRQIKEKREELLPQARDGYVAMLQANAMSMGNKIADLRKRQADKQKELSAIESDLVAYRTMEDEYKTQQEVLRNLEQQSTVERLRSGSDSSRVLLFSPAKMPTPDEIASPRWEVYLPAGVVGGLVMAFGLGYLLELTNTRVRTPRDITRTMQLPLLGFVPDQDDDDLLRGELSTSIRTAPGSMIAESFRQIRGRLAAQTDGAPVRSLLVSSIAPGGGATTVASNLANGMALNDLRVLLVDANFYRPGLRNIYKNLPPQGLSDVLTDPAALEKAIVESPDLPRLHLLGAGSRTSTAGSEMLESRAFKDILAHLESKYDVVIFDGAPLSLVSDSISLAAKTDGVIAVVRAGRISRGTVARVRDQLRHVNAKLLGIVLNAAQTSSSGYFKENYRTFYQYASHANGNGNGHADAAHAKASAE